MYRCHREHTLEEIMKSFVSRTTMLIVLSAAVALADAGQLDEADPTATNPVGSGFVAPVAPAGFVYYHDIEIGTGGSRTLKIDICAPARDPGKKLPVLASIHGGGWNKGNKNDHANKLVSWAEKGYVGATFQYRLTPEGAKFPAQLEDVKLAVRYLKANADKYFLDPSKIAVWGSSAGGHLAALLATTGHVKELEGSGGWHQVDSSIACAVDFSGPADFTTEFSNRWSSVTKLLGQPAKVDLDKARAAMPGTYAAKSNASLLVLHGNADPVVPYTDSVYFVDQLRTAGADVIFGLVGGAGHSLSAYGWTAELAYAFLDWKLKGIGQRPADPPAPTPVPVTLTPRVPADASVPVVAYSFDETSTQELVQDKAAFGLNIALKRNNGEAQEYGEGKFGRALRFTQPASYVSNEMSSATDPMKALNFSSAMSLELWVKLDKPVSAYNKNGSAKLLYKVNGSKRGYELYLNGKDDLLKFKVWHSQDKRHEVSSGSVKLNQTDRWYHIVATCDGNDLIMYIDGEQTGITRDVGGIGVSENYDLKIGANSTSVESPSGIMGYIDELKMYAGALSVQQVKQLYQRGNASL